MMTAKQARIQERVLRYIREERDRQDDLWGSGRQMSEANWYLILGEEVGEVAEALLDGKTKEEVRAELVQVAAVAVCWLESMETS